MKDIPVFTGGGGIATLILKEIPYKNTAYVLLRSYLPQQRRLFFEECWRFCRAAGAQRVLLCAQTPEPDLPLEYELLKLVRPAGLPLPVWPEVTLRPVTPDSLEQYVEIYNQLFLQVPGAATYTMQTAGRLLEGGAYFAVKGQRVVGIGQLSGQQVLCIGVLPQYRGMGSQVLAALLQTLEQEVTLQVASDNAAALRLYQKFGFQRQSVLSYWYDLGPMFTEQ